MGQIDAETLRKNFLKILFLLSVLVGFAYILTPLFIPIVFGGILAMAFSPYLKYFTRRGWGRKLSLFLMTVVLFLMCITPIGIVIVKGTKVVSNFLSEQSFVETKEKVESHIYSFIDYISKVADIDSEVIREKLGSFIGSAGSYALNLFSSFLGSIPNILMLSFITILSFYFCLLEEDKIRRWFDRSFYFSYENSDRFIHILKMSCKEVFFSNVLTGVIQATLIASAALITKSGDFFIVFIITFFLSFIPVIGAAPTGFAVAIIAFIGDRVGPGIIMACVAAFSGIIDNIIRPYLSSRGTVEVPTFVNFLAIIGGVITLGLVGLFVAPLVASLCYGALPIILDEWYPEIEDRIKSSYDPEEERNKEIVKNAKVESER